MLLEHGIKPYKDKLFADYMFEELVDETLIDNKDILAFFHTYKNAYFERKVTMNSNYFIYHPNIKISALAVSLLNFPYEESERWKREFSQATGYQPQLFEQSYENFIKTVATDNEIELMSYLKMDEDRTNEQVDSAINYLKLRKVKRMLLENQVDMEKQHAPEQLEMLHRTHDHLKQMEIELTRKTGTVIIR
jgi:DNA primase